MLQNHNAGIYIKYMISGMSVILKVLDMDSLRSCLIIEASSVHARRKRPRAGGRNNRETIF